MSDSDDSSAPKMGRPSKFDPEYVEQAYKLALLGATDKQLADFFGVAERTINNWKDQFPDFLQSLKAGKTAADATVAQSLFRRANGYSHPAVKIFKNKDEAPVLVDYTEHYPPDATSAIFWLKNRQPELWRDKTETTTKIADADGNALSVAEIARLIAFAFAQSGAIPGDVPPPPQATKH